MLLKKFLQSMNIKCYELYFTFIENRDEKEVVNENDYFIYKDFITPNIYYARRNDNTISR